ncbi:MAG: glycerophosphodiester phosphodiesterase [Bacteroidia bacterium]|nr:glycerophosphodiester phosphodiesterase [Bacteroidia bacterium]
MKFLPIFFFFISSFLFSQTDTNFQVHAHRGFRGLYPENTIIAFKEAVKKNAYAIELDIVISKDNQLVVSHEPWFNHKICSAPNGKKVKRFHQQNLYKLNYDSIKQYDCGIRGNKKYLSQQASKAFKPLLLDVIREIEMYCKENNLPPIHYNIEIKCRKIGDDKYHPKPEVIAKLLVDVLKTFSIDERILVQSFDVRCLQSVHQLNPQLRIGLLVANFKSVSKNIKKLGFTPYMYNPNVKLVKSKTVKQAQLKNVKVIVWTANKEKDIRKLKRLKVDGIITDYPLKK